MSVKIGIIGQKGGTGKSTLSRLLAVAYKAQNASCKVKIADMDLLQQTCVQWNALRLQEKIQPEIKAESFRTVKSVLKEEHFHDVIIFDVAGQVNEETYPVAKYCDILILPSGTNRDDLIPQLRLASQLTKKGISKDKIAFTLSRVGRSERDEQNAIEVITEDFGYKYLGKVLEKTSIGQAHDTGLSALETKYERINAVGQTLADNIINFAEQKVVKS